VLFPPTCAICREPGAVVCGACSDRLRSAAEAPPVLGLDSLAALFDWDDASRGLVTALKYRNAKAVAPWLSVRLAAAASGPIRLVTWVPTTPQRRRRRGFDQAELLARSVGRRLGVPVTRLLVRDRGPAQTGAPAHLRHRGPRLRVRRPVRGPVLLVDDVCTTGASLGRAGQALHAAGADAVHGLTVARVA
jgi:predicted amidophosphoribosyltransferase